MAISVWADHEFRTFLIKERSLCRRIGIVLLVLAAWIGSLIYMKYFGTSTQVNSGALKLFHVLTSSVTLCTLAVTIFLSFSEAKSAYLESLPKILTVRYLTHPEVKSRDYCFPDDMKQTLMIAINAPLAHEGDIRNWGSQLSGQIWSRERTNISYHAFDTKPAADEFVKHLGKRHRKYYAEFYLDKPIKGEIKEWPDSINLQEDTLVLDYRQQKVEKRWYAIPKIKNSPKLVECDSNINAPQH